jgi:Ring finger domain
LDDIETPQQLEGNLKCKKMVNIITLLEDTDDHGNTRTNAVVEGSVCAVCLEAMEEQHEHDFRCGHCFRASCISQWLQTSHSCLACRNPPDDVLTKLPNESAPSEQQNWWFLDETCDDDIRSTPYSQSRPLEPCNSPGGERSTILGSSKGVPVQYAPEQHSTLPSATLCRTKSIVQQTVSENTVLYMTISPRDLSRILGLPVITIAAAHKMTYGVNSSAGRGRCRCKTAILAASKMERKVNV